MTRTIKQNEQLADRADSEQGDREITKAEAGPVGNDEDAVTNRLNLDQTLEEFIASFETRTEKLDMLHSMDPFARPGSEPRDKASDRSMASLDWLAKRACLNIRDQMEGRNSTRSNRDYWDKRFREQKDRDPDGIDPKTVDLERRFKMANAVHVMANELKQLFDLLFLATHGMTFDEADEQYRQSRMSQPRTNDRRVAQQAAAAAAAMAEIDI